MHIFGRISQGQQEFLTSSHRTAFIKNHKKIFHSASILMTIACLIISGTLGKPKLAMAITGYILGSAYIIQRFTRQGKHLLRTLSTLPVSKEVFTATAWTVFAVFLPYIDSGQSFSKDTAVTITMVFLMVFFRTAIFSFSDIEGDRMVGEDTLPVYFGKRKATLILKGLILLLTLSLLTVPSSIHRNFGIGLAGISIYIYLIQRILERRATRNEWIMEFSIDSAFVASGVLGGVFYLAG